MGEIPLKAITRLGSPWVCQALWPMLKLWGCAGILRILGFGHLETHSVAGSLKGDRSLGPSKPATLGSSGTHTAKCEVQQLTALYLLCFIMCCVFWQSVSAVVLGHLGCLDLFQITRYRRRRNGRGVEVYPHSWWSSSQLIFPHFPGKQLIVAQKIVVLNCFWAGLPLPLLHSIELFKCFPF